MSSSHEAGAQSGAPSMKVVQGLHRDAQDEAARAINLIPADINTKVKS